MRIKLKLIQIDKHCSWGIQKYLFNSEHFRSLEHDEIGGAIELNFYTMKIKGYSKEDITSQILNFIDLQDETSLKISIKTTDIYFAESQDNQGSKE